MCGTRTKWMPVTMKNIATETDITSVIGVAVLGAIAASMVGSIFSSDAWNNVTFIAGEIKNPKNIGLSLFGNIDCNRHLCIRQPDVSECDATERYCFAPSDRVAVVYLM